LRRDGEITGPNECTDKQVTGDRTRLVQAFSNVLDNAIKFSPPGGLVKIICEDKEDNAIVRVEDAGQGISSEFLPFVFERLRQEDGSKTRAHGGLGLGLALTWQPIGGPALWDLPRFVVIIPLIAALGMVWLNARYDPAGLGLRDAWAGDKSQPPETLLLVGPYRFVRHPLMACLLVFLWAQPVMTPTLALLCGGLTVYILIGVLLEERDLLRRFHPDYASYRRRVPALIPWRRPK